MGLILMTFGISIGYMGIRPRFGLNIGDIRDLHMGMKESPTITDASISIYGLSSYILYMEMTDSKVNILEIGNTQNCKNKIKKSKKVSKYT